MDGQQIDIVGRVRRNPYGMVAAALGVGFVVGGGLFTRVTSRIVGAGLRIGLMAALPVVKDELLRVAQRALDEPGLDINKGDS